MNKPPYDGEFCAFSDADRSALREIVRRVTRPGMRVAEIGSWLGNGSTRTILDAMAGVPRARLLCVDTWQGSPGVDRHSRIAAEFDVLATFKRNTADAADRIDIRIGDGAAAARAYPSRAFDLVFIDADHRYSAVRADIAAWLPKIRPGGILCGHDCEIRPTPEIADVLARGRESDVAELEGHKYAAVHAGTVLAVHEAFGGRAELFAEHTASSVWAWRVPAPVWSLRRWLV
jgi:predicted O-methyltransferase YrrM